MTEDHIIGRYLTGDYAEKNPDWDSGDALWKASIVVELLQRNKLHPRSIVEIGCGTGGVLAALRMTFPNADLSGYDIAPALTRFWRTHEGLRINFTLGNFIQLNSSRFDLLLLLDVVEHLADPFTFINRLRNHGEYVVFHIPLDLSALSVLRETPLLHARRKVGHIHYYTRCLALELLEECGYEVIEDCYTGAAFNAPRRTWKTRLVALPRRLVYRLNHHLGARLLGGETLLVLAKPRSGG